MTYRGGDLSRMICLCCGMILRSRVSLGVVQTNSSDIQGVTVIAFGALSLSNVSQLSDGNENAA